MFTSITLTLKYLPALPNLLFCIPSDQKYPVLSLNE